MPKGLAKMEKSKIWVLIDDVIGHKNQAIALADALKMPYLIKELKYNLLAKLPSLLTPNTLFGISNKEIFDDSFPDILISAGRKPAKAAIDVKKKSPKTKIIQILWPESGIKYFDLIILPKHDNRNDPYNNIIQINGSISKINPEFLRAKKLEVIDKYSSLPKPIIALIIGGNTKKGKFTESNLKELLDHANKKANGGSLLISTSRRTDKSLHAILPSLIKVPFILYNPESGSYNPYTEFLAIADALIVTGDSISMCVDCASSSKPCFIYYLEEILPDKHIKFIQNLVEHNYAALLSIASEKNFSSQKLDNLSLILANDGFRQLLK